MGAADKQPSSRRQISADYSRFGDQSSALTNCISLNALVSENNYATKVLNNLEADVIMDDEELF